MPPSGPLATALAGRLARGRADADRLAAERTALDALRAERGRLERARTEWAGTRGVAGVAAGTPAGELDPSRPLERWREAEALRQAFEAVAVRLVKAERARKALEPLSGRPMPEGAGPYRASYVRVTRDALDHLAGFDRAGLEQDAPALDQLLQEGETLRQRAQAVRDRLAAMEPAFLRVEALPPRKTPGADYGEYRQAFVQARDAALDHLATLDSAALAADLPLLDRAEQAWKRAQQALDAEAGSAAGEWQALDAEVGGAITALKKLEQPAAAWAAGFGQALSSAFGLLVVFGTLGCCGGAAADAADQGCAAGSAVGVVGGFLVAAYSVAGGDQRGSGAEKQRAMLRAAAGRAEALRATIRDLVPMRDVAGRETPSVDVLLRKVARAEDDLDARVDHGLAITPRRNPVALVLFVVGLLLAAGAATAWLVSHAPAPTPTTRRTPVEPPPPPPTSNPGETRTARAPKVDAPTGSTAAPKASAAAAAVEPAEPSPEPAVADAEPTPVAAPVTTPAEAPVAAPTPVLAAGTWIGTVDDHPLRLVVPDGGTRLTLKVVEGDKITECKVVVSGSDRLPKLSVSNCAWSGDVSGVVTDGVFTGMGPTSLQTGQRTAWSLRHVQ